MAYIANRPVRFDRSYAIGERIPDGVIDPKMTTKLIGMGRIIRIPDTEMAQEAAADSIGLTQDGDNSEGGTNMRTPKTHQRANLTAQTAHPKEMRNAKRENTGVRS